MAHQLKHLLAQWQARKDELGWALGVIYQAEGHSYRKPGALVLVNEAGEQFGLLSGGCLEADIRRNARKAIQTEQPVFKTYDGNDGYDISYQLGCGGIVHILLQPLLPENNFLNLDALHRALIARERGVYRLQIPERKQLGKSAFDVQPQLDKQVKATLESTAGETWLSIPIHPEPHLLIAGGGIDAAPLVALAKQQGWTVSLWDSRPAFARAEHFKAVDTRLDGAASSLATYCDEASVNAVVVMSHNLQLDADVITALKSTPLAYLALLGPKHRKAQVFELAGVAELPDCWPLSSPAGFDIGGELPESIALSIIAECHQYLFKN
jgi:xanthine dehydrogenase accessory factor